MVFPVAFIDLVRRLLQELPFNGMARFGFGAIPDNLQGHPY